MIDTEPLARTLDRLYKCRDLEISNLWQRSAFLSVFLTICFTAYGFMFMKFIDCYMTNWILQLGILALAAVGMIVSLIWITMSKGSKAWYEIYESAITNFEKCNYLKLGLPYENIMGHMFETTNHIDNSLFTSNPGSFSVSKINILIGQLCASLWLIIMSIHAGCFVYIFCLFKSTCSPKSLNYLIFFIGLYIGIALTCALSACMAYHIKKKVLSGFLYERTEVLERAKRIKGL